MKTTVREILDSRAKEGWYIGPSLHHYIRTKCYLPSIKRGIDADTVVFLQKHIKYPEVSVNDFLQQAVFYILSLLKQPPPSTVLSLQAEDEPHNAILQIAT